MNDYYPFGMLMPGRRYQPEDYRFGFNDKENLNDVKGVAKIQDYGMRIYDPRLGKFLSVDPLTSKFPWYSPYQFSGNNPIWATDLDGAEPLKVIDQDPISVGKPILRVQTIKESLQQINEKEILVHNLIQNLDLPESYKDPLDKSNNYNVVFNTICNNLQVKNESDVPWKEYYSLANSLELTSKPKDKLATEVGLIAAKTFSKQVDNKITTFIAAEFIAGKLFFVVDLTLDSEPLGESSTPKKQVENITKKAFENYVFDHQQSSTGKNKLEEKDKYTTTATDHQ